MRSRIAPAAALAALLLPALVPMTWAGGAEPPCKATRHELVIAGLPVGSLSESILAASARERITHPPRAGFAPLVLALAARGHGPDDVKEAFSYDERVVDVCVATRRQDASLGSVLNALALGAVDTPHLLTLAHDEAVMVAVETTIKHRVELDRDNVQAFLVLADPTAPWTEVAQIEHQESTRRVRFSASEAATTQELLALAERALGPGKLPKRS